MELEEEILVKIVVQVVQGEELMRKTVPQDVLELLIKDMLEETHLALLLLVVAVEVLVKWVPTQ